MSPVRKRPLAVTITAWLYILVGIVGFTYHLGEFRQGDVLRSGVLWVECLRVLAVVAGAFMLRACNWARWLALAWIAVHVILSAFHSLAQFSMHALFCAAVWWALFRPAANGYFRRGSSRD